jgi:GPI mannosyltransferase 1 subunit M
MSLLLFPKTKAGIRPTDDAHALATLCAMLHLLNPLVFSISTRGSSEAVLGTLVLLTLAYALRGRWDAAAVGLGLASHWKLYPIVYGVACLGVIGGGKGWRRLINQRTIRFTVLSAGTFAFLGLGCYLV